MGGDEQIKKLSNYAELAWASYGYFHLADKDYSPNGWWNKDKKKLDEFIKNNKRIPTHTDILNIEYKQIFKGDFTPTQAQRFFEHYELIHQPNTKSGFSATLFAEKKKQNTDSNKITYAAEYGYINYILAIRGTESPFPYYPCYFGELDSASCSRIQYT